jgi:hypothetical protein
MIRRKTTTFAGFMVTVVALLLVLSGISGAAVLFERGYGDAAKKGSRIIEGNHPNGFRPKVESGAESGLKKAVDPLDYAIVKGENLNPDSGSIAFRLKYVEARKASSDGSELFDTLFTILDSSGKYLMTVSILWPEATPSWYLGSGFGGIKISSDKMPDTVWGRWIPFNQKINPGDQFTITLTWEKGVNKVYLNNRELTAKYDHYLDLSTVGVASPAEDAVPFGKGDFAGFISAASRLRIGADNEVSNRPLLSGSVEYFEIHNQAIVPVASKPVIASVTDDSFKVPGISGKLVSGETVTATLVAEPGGKASFDMGAVKGVPMVELAADPGGSGKAPVVAGTYQGSYTIKPGDDFTDGQIAGQFVSADNVAADPVLSASRWTIETKPVVTFSIASKDLPADAGTKSRIKLTAKDANGNPLKGRNLKLTLSTTDEYTGLVGAGDFGKQVGASVETRWKGATDAWGEVEFDYVAGFAAKTVILQAKDLDSGGVSVDYITAYKEASIDIALTAPRSLAAARRGMQYMIKVEASRTQLTADGKSRSIIRATVTDPNGKPVAGDDVAFALSSPNGTLRAITGSTDSAGVATAEYIAGKKIGIVVISATDTIRNVSGNVSILLLADAPAKIILKARPESLPADGNSKADIQVKVTDINDNPNKDTRVEFKVSQGVGKLDYADRTTDTFGDALNRFTAGTTPGIATILATVRSKVPTAAELLKAKNVLFVPYNEAGDQIRIEKWLKKKGDKVLLGEPIVTYTVGRGNDLLTIKAPYDLTVDETFVEYWDNAEVGQTLATVIPTVK